MIRVSVRTALGLLLAWTLVLFLVGQTVRHYALPGFNPFWDNLGYQTEALRLTRLMLDGDLRGWFHALARDSTPLHSLSLSTAFLVTGLRPDAPYISSAAFGFLALAGCFLLACELGAEAAPALAGTLLVSVLPQFFYQNFLQTRNDFPLAACITLGWALLLRALREERFALGAAAGAIAGAGTLLKPSAPGYVVWGLACMALLPLGRSARAFGWKLRLIAAYAGAAVCVCGVPYLSNLRVTLGYYAFWAHKRDWIQVQYGLSSLKDRVLFYLTNFPHTHVPAPVLIAVAALVVAGLLRPRRGWFFESGAALVLAAYLVPMLFLTLRGSLASLGDVPVLLLLFALVIAWLARQLPAVLDARVTLVALPLLLLISVGALPIAERGARAADLGLFSSTLLDVLREYHLEDVARWQVYSHPAYNVEAARWCWLLDPRNPSRDVIEADPDSPRRRTTGYLRTDRVHTERLTQEELVKFLDPEIADSIAAEFERVPLVVLMDGASTGIGGEPFHAWNRLQDGITRHIDASGCFVRVRTLPIENGARTLRFLVNSAYAVCKLPEPSADGWTVWRSAVDLVGAAPVVLHIEGVPATDLTELVLQPVGSGPPVVLPRVSIGDGGRYAFEAVVPLPAGFARRSYVLTGSERAMHPASDGDPRPLALHDVSVALASADVRLEPATADGWALWGSRVSLVLQQPAAVRLTGMPAAPFDTFTLVDESGRERVHLKKTGAGEGGRVQFDSTEVLPPTPGLDLHLSADARWMTAASAQDPRKLAFRAVAVTLVGRSGPGRVP